MRGFSKGQEPHELTEYRAEPDAVYDGPQFTAVKEIVRAQLLQDQGYLCAYCMKRINSGAMKVEHWHSQTRYPPEQLDFQNMLGCCLGNKGNPPEAQHCDTRKGDSDISYNPANPAHHTRLGIHYLGDGRIRSDDAEFDRQINETLNLNYARLRTNRKAVVEAVRSELNRTAGHRTCAEIQRLLDSWERTNVEGRLPEFCGVAIYFLQKRLQKAR